MSPFGRILVVVDGSPEGQRALDAAIALAAALNSQLRALVIEGRLPRYAATLAEVDDAKRKKDELYETVARLAAEQAAEKGVELEVELALGAATAAIADVAEREQHDLVVVGYRRRSFGRVADHLCHHADCPVLVVRGDRDTGWRFARYG
jgi:nucleotide-binding universal stress UspA family protein